MHEERPKVLISMAQRTKNQVKAMETHNYNLLYVEQKCRYSD